jgi:hypothetical protein
MRLQQQFAVGEMGFRGRLHSSNLMPSMSGLGQKRISKHIMSALPQKQTLAVAFVTASPSGGRSVVTVPSGAPRRFFGGALRSVRWGEVLSSMIGSQASTESKF